MPVSEVSFIVVIWKENQKIGFILNDVVNSVFECTGPKLILVIDHDHRGLIFVIRLEFWNHKHSLLAAVILSN